MMSPKESSRFNCSMHLLKLLMLVSSYERMSETMAEATHVFNRVVRKDLANHKGYFALTFGESKPGGL